MMGTERFWDKKIKHNYFTISKSGIYNHKLNLVVSFLSNKTGRLLDIGFGYGILEKKLIEVNKNLELSGIDISGYSVSKISKTVKGQFKKANIKNIPFKDNSFDFVLALDVLEHLKSGDIVKSFQEINRVLKDNSKVIISVPLNEKKYDFRNNKHIQVYNPSKLKSQLDRFNFKINRTIYLSAFKEHFLLKNVLNNIFRFAKPNLIIIIATKR